MKLPFCKYIKQKIYGCANCGVKICLQHYVATICLQYFFNMFKNGCKYMAMQIYGYMVMVIWLLYMLNGYYKCKWL